MHQLRILLLILALIGCVLSALARRLGVPDAAARKIRLGAISLAVISIGTFWLLVAIES